MISLQFLNISSCIDLSAPPTPCSKANRKWLMNLIQLSVTFFCFLLHSLFISFGLTSQESVTMDEIKSISWVLGLFYSEKINKTIYLVVYSFFVKVVFVLRFLFNFLRESRKGKQSQLKACGLFSFAVEGDTHFFTCFPL